MYRRAQYLGMVQAIITITINNYYYYHHYTGFHWALRAQEAFRLFYAQLGI